MAKSSISHLDKDVIFHQTFNSLKDISDNGGVVTGDLVLRDGWADFSAGALITYPVNVLRKGRSGGLTNFTMICKLKNVISASPQNIALQVDISNNNRSFLVSLLDVNNFRVALYGDGTSSSIKNYYITAPLVEGEVAILGYTFSPNNLQLYKDGELAAVTKSHDNSFNQIFISSITPFLLGTLSGNVLSSPIEWFTIFNRTLTASEMKAYGQKALYKKIIKKPLMFATKFLNETLVDEVTITQPTLTDCSVVSKIGGDVISIPSNGEANFGSRTFNTVIGDYVTIMGWVKPDIQAGANNQLLVNWHKETTPHEGLGVYISKTDGAVGTYNVTYNYSTFLLTDKKWNFFCVKYYIHATSGTIDVAMNNSVFENIKTGDTSNAVRTSNTFKLGRFITAHNMTGDIGDVLILRRNVSEEEKTRHYQSTKERYGL